MTEIMLDIETLGTSYNAPIVAIGAVYFEWSGNLGEEFYCNVCLDDPILNRFDVDCTTVGWWLQQNDSAREALTKPGYSLKAVLESLGRFVTGKRNHVWGNGVGFDNVIVGNAYKVLGMKRPWHYRDDRDCRTMVWLARQFKLDLPEVQDGGTYHNALDDAMRQVKWLTNIYKQLEERNGRT